MKQFKLLKDLPSLKSGCIFNFMEYSIGAIYCNEKTKRVYEPHYDFEAKSVENAPTWFEEIKR